MAPKRKQAKPRSKSTAVGPDVVKLAILTAILDPTGVQRDLSFGRLPDSFPVALDLIDKIHGFMNGRQNLQKTTQLIRAEEVDRDREMVQRIEASGQPSNEILTFDIKGYVRRSAAAAEWKLDEGERLSLLEATKQKWCYYHDERWLLKLLQRNGFPFD
ncbi:MAG: hypothetical protein WAK31_09110, partial [Chthoniobacterales bacterium]